MKKQTFNSKLVSDWDNFTYRENFVKKKIRNIVKFKFIIMAL